MWTVQVDNRLTEYHLILYKCYCLQNGQKNVCNNAYKQYLKSRPGASVESVKRVKELNLPSVGIHPLFSNLHKADQDKTAFLAAMKQYRPQGVSTHNKYNFLTLININ